jgi:hypothetical protein
MFAPQTRVLLRDYLTTDNRAVNQRRTSVTSRCVSPSIDHAPCGTPESWHGWLSSLIVIAFFTDPDDG